MKRPSDLKEYLQQRVSSLELEGEAKFISLYFANEFDFSRDMPRKTDDYRQIYEFLFERFKSVNLDNLDIIYPKPEEDHIQANTESSESKHLDLRVLSIELENFRGIPKREHPFKISFSDNDEPMNCVVYGQNGSGKSSVFQAMEFMYCKSIGEADLREFKGSSKNIEGKYEDYLAHKDSTLNEVKCNLETKNGSYNLYSKPLDDAKIRSLLPNSYFISDYDIYENGKLDYDSAGNRSIHNKIAVDIGFEDQLLFINMVSGLASYIKNRQAENKDNKRYETQIKEQKDLIENYQKDLDILKNELIDNNSNPKHNDNSEKEKQTLSMLLLYLQKSPVINVNLDTYRSKLVAVTSAYLNYTSHIISSLDSEEVAFLETGLKFLERYGECPYCRSSSISHTEIEKIVTKKIQDNKGYQDRKLYLNQAADDLISFNDILVAELEFNHQMIKDDINLFTQQDIDSADIGIFNHLYESIDSVLSRVRPYTSTMRGKTDINVLISLSSADKTFTDIFISYDELITSLVEIYNGLHDWNNERIKLLDKLIKRREQIPSEEKQFRTRDVIQEEMNTKKKAMDTAETKITELKHEQQQTIDILGKRARIKDAFDLYYQKLEEQVNAEISNLFTPIKETFQRVLNEYLKRDGINVSIDIVDSIIRAKVILPSNEPMDPKKYFNTFRYRLFSMVVSLSTAIAVRKYVNLPFVFDDVFYGSDFNNRAEIQNFVESILIVLGKEKGLKPQLVFFTHDDLVFESIMHVLYKEEYATHSMALRLVAYNKNSLKENFYNLAYRLRNYDAIQSNKQEYGHGKG